VEWLADKLTALFRPWHNDGLPEELAFGEIVGWVFVRGSMTRAARLAVEFDVPFGVFGIIGIAYARRAARAWWPKERLLMEDVSCAFQPIADRACRGQPISALLIDRLVFVLGRYLRYVGPTWPEEELREAMERYIREAPREDIPDGQSPDAQGQP
jgi:hypothetical protein